MKKRRLNIEILTKICCFVLVLSTICFGFVGCKKKTPKIPEQLETEDNNGIEEPIVNVYNTTTEQVEQMPLETYLLGVVAGEMPNNFPSEALKAQAIIARTFTMYFIANRQSKYEGADISTDISEAQAYAPENINDAICEAIAETKGKVLAFGGEFIETWFHSNAGGKTASTTEAFVGSDGDPEFIKLATSPETENNAQNTTWSVWLSRSEMLSALSKMGKSVSTLSTISIEEKGPSGRATALKFGDTVVSAPEFRIAVGSTKMKSTLISNIVVDKSGATFEGKGYGHGVGLSQWGAKILAEEGKDAENIIDHYFKKVDLVELY